MLYAPPPLIIKSYFFVWSYVYVVNMNMHQIFVFKIKLLMLSVSDICANKLRPLHSCSFYLHSQTKCLSCLNFPVLPQSES